MSRRSRRYQSRIASFERLENRTLLDAAVAEIAQDWLSQSPAAVPYRDNTLVVRLRDNSGAGVLAAAGGAAQPTSSPALWQVNYESGARLNEALALLQKSQFVISVEPMQEMKVALTPNDSSFATQWALNNTGQSGGTVDADIDAPEAWNRRTSAMSVIVADIDTGVDYRHPDLYKNIWINQGEIPVSRRVNLTDVDGDGVITFWDLNEPVNIGGNKISDLNGNGYIDGEDLLVPMLLVNGADGGGGWANSVSDEPGGDPYVDDIIGWDFYNNDNNPLDDHGHGTHTAGTIGAMGNNSIGVAGIAWKTQIMVLKFLGAGGSGSDLGGALSTTYAAAKGARISNNSWGGGGSSTLSNAISDAGAANHLFIAAAGNGSVNTDSSPFYPAAYTHANIVSVTATTRTDSQVYNYGAVSVDLGAPGAQILSTYKQTNGAYVYATTSGTSMAAPHVAGAAVLVKAQRPSWNFSQIKTHLMSTVDPLASLAGKTASGGRLNLQKALANIAPTDLALSNNSIAENQPASSNVGTLSATDPDLGDTFTYSLVAGTGSADNGSFTIAGSVLKTSASFDFESKNSYSIRVRTTDQGGLFFDKIFTINVTNVNETPTDLSISNSAIAENQPAGSIVGSLSTVDPDAGDSFSYVLAAGAGSTDNASFSIDGGVLKTAAPLDFETKNSYSIRVRSTDAGGLIVEKALTIQVTDVSESAPPVLGGISGAAAVAFKENAVATLISGAATVTDADSPHFDGGVLTVSYASGGSAEDQLSVKSIGVGANQISISGNSVIYTKRINNVPTPIPIGSFTGGANGTSLVVTFNASATKTEVQAALRAIAFFNGSESPSTTPRVVNFVLTDGDDGISNIQSRTVNVTSVNDKPLVTVSPSHVSFIEGGASVIIDAGVIISDVDSTDFSTGKLIVKAVLGGQSTDRFGIDASGPISVAGTAVSYNGTPIGTFAGTTSLTVTLNGEATPARVQELARHIVFSNISGAPSPSAREISFTVSDGDGGTSLAALGDTVDISIKNDAPQLTLSNATTAKYTENAAAILISSAATVLDVDLLDFDNGKLTVTLTGAGTGADILSVKDVGLGANQVSVDGETIRFTNSLSEIYPVATFTGGNGGIPLVVTFNTRALRTEVQAVMRAITFANSSDKPSIARRTVSFTLTDGDGGTSNTVVRDIDVTAKNDAPLVNFGSDIDFTIGEPYALISPTAMVSDIDSDDFNGGRLTVALGAGRNAADRVEIQNGNGITAVAGVVSHNGKAIGTYSGTTSLVISFNSGFATPDAVEALLRQISFRAPTVGLSTTRVVTASLTDGDGGTSTLASKTIHVHT